MLMMCFTPNCALPLLIYSYVYADDHNRITHGKYKVSCHIRNVVFSLVFRSIEYRQGTTSCMLLCYTCMLRFNLFPHCTVLGTNAGTVVKYTYTLYFSLNCFHVITYSNTSLKRLGYHLICKNKLSFQGN